MMIVSYDFEDTKRRTKFATFLKNIGRRLQYSVFELKNSARVLENIQKVIDLEYKPYFTKNDSIIIISVCEACRTKIKRYGYAVNEEKSVVFF